MHRVHQHACLTMCTGMLLACGGGNGTSKPDASVGTERRLVIFHTNDEHSHLFGFGPEIDDFPTKTTAGTGAIKGSVLRRATVLAKERAAAKAAGIDTVTVSAGDETQGAFPQVSFETTAPDFTIMKALEYDVMCPGNHEFDLGPAAFARAIKAARDKGGMPQIVSTNMHFDAESPLDDDLAALTGEGTSNLPIKRYHVLTTKSGIKIGFIGIMGEEASRYAPLKTPVRFSGNPQDEGDKSKILPALYEDIRPSIEALRSVEKVDLVVAVSHGGVYLNALDQSDDYLIAKNVAGIDLLVGGHSHTPLAEPIVVDGVGGVKVPIVQAGSYGEYLGRVEIVLKPGKRPEVDLDPAKTKLISIDDKIVPSAPELASKLDGVIRDLEERDLADGKSFLETALSRIEGTSVTDDPTKLGDLYYRPQGKIGFDIVLRPFQETNVLNLSADAMLWQAEKLVGPTLISVQGAGVVRDDIRKGEKGVLAFADLFRTVPLGENPVDGSVGYPLVRFYIRTVEIKAALEVSVSRGLTEDSQFMVGSGMKVFFDTARAPQDLSDRSKAMDPKNGRVTKILIDTNHGDGYDNPTVALFDIGREGAEWDSELGGALDLHPVATNYYVASFAASAGVTLKDEVGSDLNINDTILKRRDGSDVKDWEAFIAYIRNECEKNGGTLPDRYDETSENGKVPRRMICQGPKCP